jgi:hypothetical protein
MRQPRLYGNAHTFVEQGIRAIDLALAWTGVKDSGRGCSLARLGYEALTRPKSFHLRTTL